MFDKLVAKIKKLVASQKGFTLIELLVATAIIGALAVVASTIFSSILRSQNKTAIINEVRQNGNIVIDKFERDVKQSSVVSMVGCPTDCEGPTVTLTNYSGGDTTWNCDPATTTTANSFQRNDEDVINTDQDNGVKVDSCNFIVTTKRPNTPQIVTLTFTLSQGSQAPTRAEFQSSVDFEATVGTRAY